MNPMNRRMFRDPRAARRATGILASSAPLMTAAQKAMAQGQPMRAQTGASVNLNDLYPDDPRYKRMPIIGGPSVSVSEARRPPAVDRGPFGYLEQYRAMSMDPSLAGPTDNPFLRIGNFIPQNILTDAFKRSSVKSPARQAADAELARQAEVQRTSYTSRFDPPDLVAAAAMPAASSIPTSGPVMPVSERFRATDEDVPYGRTAEDATGGSGVPLGPLERMRLAELQSMRNQESAPDAKAEAGKKTASVKTTAAEDLVKLAEDTKKARPQPTRRDPFATDGLGPERKRSPGKGVSKTQDQAEQNDKDLGIDPKLSRKERVEQRYQTLKDLLGEEEAKDVRTDKNYNLMMLGLRIAAGQSEDALSNIAAGAGQQLAEFGEVKGALQQQQQQQERELKMLATTEVGEEIAAEEARAFTTSERIGGEIARAAMQDTELATREAMQVNSQASQAAESALGRDAAAFLANSEQQLRVQLTEINQKFQGEQSRLDREAAVNNLIMTQRWQATEASKGRIYDLGKTMAAQAHAKEMGIDEQHFRIRLAEFTASLPGETQRLYEKYLSSDEIGDVIVKSITGKTTSATPSRADWTGKRMDDEDMMMSLRRDIAASLSTKDAKVEPTEVTQEQIVQGLNTLYDAFINYQPQSS